MTQPHNQRPTRSGAGAGFFLLSTVLLCAAVGALIGVLAGSLVFGAVVGTMVGFAIGIALVIVRFRDL